MWGPIELSGDGLVDALTAPVEPDFAGGVVVVHGDLPDPDDPRRRTAVERLVTLPCVVAGTGVASEPDELVDVVAADDAELSDVLATVQLAPVASVSLALHLRASPRRGVADGLVAESALYSALQAGPEHAAWRSSTPRRRREDPDPHRPRVAVERDGAVLRLTLCRPQVRNALDSRMRDELLEALGVALADPSTSVELRGEGGSFCSGGDLDEFGTAPDPATAHVVRLRTSLGAVLARLSDRTTVHVHGPCAGSGVELPAFAGQVVAAPDTTVRLPELGMGLVPGAGGTVSLPRRIGRHRTAWLALTRRQIGAERAHSWGLVDRLSII